jgi:hypothetical protein
VPRRCLKLTCYGHAFGLAVCHCPCPVSACPLFSSFDASFSALSVSFHVWQPPQACPLLRATRAASSPPVLARPALTVFQGWIDRSLLDRTRALLQAARLPISVPPPMTVELFKSLMAVDKKVRVAALRDAQSRTGWMRHALHLAGLVRRNW